MVVLRVLVGLAVLVLGRKLFWLFVGAAGFVLGISLAALFFRGQPDWVVLIIALAAGLVGVLLALFLQQVAVGLAGLIAGGYFVINVLNVLGREVGQAYWPLVLIGGIIGGVLALVLFDWALIVLSSLTGATVITQAVHIRPLIAALLFVVLLVAGIMIQASLMQRDQSSPAPPAKA